MKLYWAPKTRSLRLVWMMEEIGMPYERTRIDIRNDDSRANAEFRSASPMGKVPALIDGSVRMWDSGAMCAYLADQYPANKLAPPIGDPLRAEYLMWLMYTNSVIEPAMAEKFANLKPNASAYGWGSWDQMLAVLRKGVDRGPWVLGQRFTAADVLLGMSCMYMRQFKLLDVEPILDAYANRCMQRPALQRAMTIEAEG